ncbi:MAG: hypothetical protein BRC29_03440 [Nanohaloarchaea archaeon SW_7_43_1]|nr:MAG: hypothetical protein BRC29_03440 [Nanohaloarchaea archaeon SW_7_43_1]
MPTIDPVSTKNKKKLNLAKVVLTDEEGSEPTFDEVLDWLFESEEVPDEMIKEELQELTMEEMISAR